MSEQSLWYLSTSHDYFNGAETLVIRESDPYSGLVVAVLTRRPNCDEIAARILSTNRRSVEPEAAPPIILREISEIILELKKQPECRTCNWLQQRLYDLTATGK